MTTMPATFTDSRGSEQIEFQTSGTWLTTKIRGIDFAGREFDSLTPEVASDQFDLCHGDLCGCHFRVEMPVRLNSPEGLRHVHVQANINLGLAHERFGYTEGVRVGLVLPELSIVSSVDTGFFEDALLSLNSQLPEGFSLEACITCGLSDYSPAGNGSFGCLACFRNEAAQYRQVRSKSDIFALWDRMTEYVQETHYCPCFEKRLPGTGYRG